MKLVYIEFVFNGKTIHRWGEQRRPDAGVWVELPSTKAQKAADWGKRRLVYITEFRVLLSR